MSTEELVTFGEAREAVLHKALRIMTTKQRRAILAEFSERRFGMRSSSTAGHAWWYPRLVQEERHAAEILGFPAPRLDQGSALS